MLRSIDLPAASSLRALLLAGVAALALSACATNRTTTSPRAPDYSGQSPAEVHAAVDQLGARYRDRPQDKTTIIYYSAALRANGQTEQAVAVAESGMRAHGRDAEVRIAYAKALASAGRFGQALNVIDDTINPAQPDWNALSVKGAIFDQSGRHQEARAIYRQAMAIAPHEASIQANLGLSFAMTNDLEQAEQTLRRATQMRGATSRIRQNLALVIALQGRFEEARALFAAELPADQVESNMAYIRALLTQQNRWDAIREAG